MDHPILFLTRSWHGYGGMQRLSRDVAQELKKACPERCTVIHPLRPGIIGWIGLSMRSMRAGWALRGMRPFIHTGDMSLLPLGCFIKLITGGRLSITACGLDVIYPKRWYQWMIRLFFRYVDRFVAISAATADQLRARDIPSERIVIIPCGIDDRYPAPIVPAEPGVLVTVGRLTKRKGVAWFVEHVLPNLRDVPGLRYVVVGSGPDEGRIRALIHRYELGDTVELHTHLSDEARDAMVSRAMTFLAPNIPIPGDMEGFGIVCIEASARGVPVLAAKLEGLQDAVIEGETGVFFEAGNAVSCEYALRRLMDEVKKTQETRDKRQETRDKRQHVRTKNQEPRTKNLANQSLNRVDIRQATLTRFGWSRIIPQYLEHVFSR